MGALALIRSDRFERSRHMELIYRKQKYSQPFRNRPPIHSTVRAGITRCARSQLHPRRVTGARAPAAMLGRTPRARRWHGA